MAEHNTTGAMREFGSTAGTDDPGVGPLAGMVLLYAEEHESLPASWPLSKRRHIVGRDDSADVRISTVSAVSRIHAEITWDSGWLLRDLGSKNGTLVDGRMVSEAQLEALNEVRFGDAILKFVDRHAEVYARYRIDGSMSPGARRRCRGATSLVGGYQMDRIAADIERIAPAELSVMLLGESGTGKEVVARELHRMSGRRGPFCAVNCAAIPGSLIESELFGYKRGAFSGADRDKPGLIRAADNGTLLLDEIGDMPLEAQAKLLRVLQSKEVFPLGSTTPEHVDIRIVCATHCDLARLQDAGRFRKDLFGRLNEYQLRLPPLRERKEDIFMLMRAFLTRHGRPELRTSFPFMTALLHHDWPYNVRELEACIKRCVALCEAPVLGEEQLPDALREAMLDYGQRANLQQFRPAPGGTTPPTIVASQGAPLPPAAQRNTVVPSDGELRALLQFHRGNVAAVGRQLGKARMQIHRWMKRYGIEVDDYR